MVRNAYYIFIKHVESFKYFCPRTMKSDARGSNFRLRAF